VTAFAKRLRFSQLGVSISLKKGEIAREKGFEVFEK